MWLKELFQKNDVLFPDWLSNDLLNDEWEDATYLKGENIHKWECHTQMGMGLITLSDEEYSFESYDENNQLLFEKRVTPDYEMIS